MKSIKIQLPLNKLQSSIIDNWINTSNYIYNKTVSYIKNGYPANFMNLRDLLVTSYTKKNSDEYKSYDNLSKELKETKKEIYNKLNKARKDKSNNIKILESQLDIIQEKINNLNKERRDKVKSIKGELNKNVQKWELDTPKEIRASAVNDACIAYKTGYSQLSAGIIKYFNISFRKKIYNKTVSIPSSFIKNVNGEIILAPKFFGKNNSKIKLNKKTLKKHKNLIISNDCRIIKKYNKYYLLVPQEISIENKKPVINYCGIDPGIRSFMTVFGNNNCKEYNYDMSKIYNLNNQIDNLKSYKRIRKKALNKREIKKKNLIDELHWKTINQLVTDNDMIFYGDIKSHNIVGNSKNKKLNRNFNDLKFYLFKSRLTYKISLKNKLLFIVNEANTTKTCSFCGTINNPLSDKIYKCDNCNIKIGRDVNAAKNILMKGILTNQ